MMLSITGNDIPISNDCGAAVIPCMSTVQNKGQPRGRATAGYKLVRSGRLGSIRSARVLLDPSDSIGSGQSKTFTFTMTAPSPSWQLRDGLAMVREGRRMVRRQRSSTSGNSSTVVAATYEAVFVSSDMPTTMVTGQTYTVHITVQNTGTTTWTAPGIDKLGFVGDHPAVRTPTYTTRSVRVGGAWPAVHVHVHDNRANHGRHLYYAVSNASGTRRMVRTSHNNNRYCTVSRSLNRFNPFRHHADRIRCPKTRPIRGTRPVIKTAEQASYKNGPCINMVLESTDVPTKEPNLWAAFYLG